MSGQPALVVTSVETTAAAAATVRRYARDPEDLAELLAMCGLPTGEDDLDQPRDDTPDESIHPAPGACMDDNPAAASAAASPLDATILMAWGEQHPTARIRGLAARARIALAELGQAKEREAAVSDAEASVQRLREQLARAEARLRDAKGNKPSAAKWSREELAKIRAWAKKNGHEVADRGLPARHIIEAYEAAQ